MYQITTDTFDLQIGTTVYWEDIDLPINTILQISLCSCGFSAQTTVDTSAALLSRFATELKTLYTTLSGSAKLSAPYSEDHLLFSALSGGHIQIQGILHRDGEFSHTLTFENQFDQTYLQNFVAAICADWMSLDLKTNKR